MFLAQPKKCASIRGHAPCSIKVLPWAYKVMERKVSGIKQFYWFQPICLSCRSTIYIFHWKDSYVCNTENVLITCRTDISSSGFVVHTLSLNERITVTEQLKRAYPYYFSLNQSAKRPTSKSFELQCEMIMDECDWYLLAGNDQRTISHNLNRLNIHFVEQWL